MTFMQRSIAILSRCLLCAVLLVGVGVGCSGRNPNYPELAEVTGTLTVNGKPVKNVTVTFTPKEGGRASHGSTDADGNFYLKFGGSDKGAILGQHEVTFVYSDADGAADALPRRYADQSASMAAEVTKEGPNQFSFDLKGK